MADAIGFAGVTYANSVSLTSTADGSAFAFIYDDFVVEWLPGEAAEKTGKSQTRSIVLAARPGTKGSVLAADIRGASYGNLGDEATLTFKAGSESISVPLPRGEEDPNFYQHLEYRLADDETPTSISIEVSLPSPDPMDTQAAIQVDSIDVTLSAGTSGDGCPAD